MAREAPPLILADGDTISERAHAYERWLSHESRRAGAAAGEEFSQASIEGYAWLASQEVQDRGRRFYPFAPYNAAYSALRTFTVGQLLALDLLAVGLVVALAFGSDQTLTGLLSALTVFYLFDLILTAFVSTLTLRRDLTTIIPNDVVRAVRDGFWPSYTILCPLYHEVEVAGQFARAMRLIEYPTDRLQVLFLTEEDDRETRNALLAMRLPRHFEVVTVPRGAPRTKPRACNYGLMRATGDFIVIFDAEDIPDPLQLKKAALTFAHEGPDVACVQASLNFYNPRQNILTRWFTAEYSLWFGLTLPALLRVRSFLPLGGTSNHFRARALREVGGWDPFNVTEDCDLGVRLAHYHYRTAMVDSTTYEEANPDLKNWLRQRSRWIKGYMQTYLVHMRNPARYLREGRLGEFFWLQVIVGGRTFTQLVNPILWAMTLAYVFFHKELKAPYHILYPSGLFYAAAICLVFGNMLYIYMYVIGCLIRGQYTLALWAPLIPIYWALTSAAAYIALFQLVTRPHYWEKTRHGLSRVDLAYSRPLRPTEPPAAAAARIEEARALAARTGKMAAQRARAATPALARQTAGQKAGRAPKPPLLRFLAGKLHGPVGIYLAGEVARARRDARLDHGRDARVAESLLLPVAPVVDQFSTVRIPTRGPAPASAVERARITDDLDPADATTATLPVVVPTPAPRRPAAPTVRLERKRDGWLAATLVTAIIASVSACVYFFQRGELLLYNDSESHMRLARLVFYSKTPGLSQLGSNWLPLPHILMWPFVWNDYLWSTGLAGALAAMPCYVVAAVYTYLIARELTGNGAASYIGALALILNPNVLYLQTTPLGEVALLAVTAATCYYFVHWARNGRLTTLLSAAFCALLGVWTRYEGWAFFAALLAMVAVVGLFKRGSMRRITGDVTLFALPGLAGMALWMAWDYMLTGNPRYFQNGPYSPSAQQAVLREAGKLPTYHNIQLDILTYGGDLAQFFGPLLLALAVVGLALFLIKRWRSPMGMGALALLAPVGLYIVSLYSGQTVIYIQGVTPAPITDPVFNVSYAAPAAVPLAIFLAQLARGVRWRWAQGALVAIILAQTALTATGGIISVQDGLWGISCQGVTTTDLFLMEHYNNLPIMLDTFYGPHNFATLGINSSKVIYAGNYQVWPLAAAHPSEYVDWVVITRGDTVDKAVNTQTPEFESHFVLVFVSKGGTRIYYSRSAPVMPARPAPTATLATYARCPTTAPATPPAGKAPPMPSSPPNGPHARALPPASLWLASAGADTHAQGVSQ